MAGRLIVNAAQWALSFASLSKPEITSKKSLRLRGDMKPLEYDLVIRTDLESKHFWGAESIKVETVRKTSKIEFHAGCNLNITTVLVCLPNRQCRDIPAKYIDRECDSRTITIDTGKFNTFHQGDQFELAMRWDSPLSPGGDGYGPSPDVGFETPGYSAITRFEPIDARNAFPGWDEPAPKASWKMTMLGKNGTVNLANMDLKSESHVFQDTKLSTLESWTLEGMDLDGSWILSEFHQTPVMSPNNVAWGNGRFTNISSSYFSPLLNKTIPTAVYSNYKNSTGQSWLLKVMDTVMPIYEKMFHLAYPLPKLFWMATPAFPGGIEHWGLITGSSESTLWSKQSGGAKQASIASFAAHEIAHQWFANVVTMEWWTDLWLNEAFATWASAEMGPYVMKDFNTWLPFQTSVMDTALEEDAMESHPIIFPIVSDSQWGDNFGKMTYNKGASVLRMIAAVIGKDNFFTAVSKYLNKFAYQNTEGKQLWHEVAKFSGDLDLPAFADAWTFQAGYPVVHVERLGNNSYRLTQERFFADGPKRSEKNTQTWPIPLFAIPEEQMTTMTPIMNETSLELTISGADQLVPNRGRLGFYRVQYDDAGSAWMRKQFTKKSSSLPGIDRGVFLSDMVAFASAARAPTVEVMELINHLQGETDVTVWDSAAGFMTKIRSMFWEAPAVEQLALKDWIASVITETHEKNGYRTRNDDSATVQKIRQATLALAGFSGVPSFVDESSVMLSTVYRNVLGRGDITDLSDIPDYAVAAMMATAVRYGGTNAWRSAHRIYQKDVKGPYAAFALSALTQSQDPILINGTLSMFDDGALIDNDDRMSKLAFIRGMNSNPAARRAMTEYCWHNLDKLLVHRGLGWQSIPATMFGQLTSREDLDLYKKRFSDPKYDYLQGAMKAVFDMIEHSGSWLIRDGKSMTEWLFQQGEMA